MSTRTGQSHFTPELFAFLRDLKVNNDRDWFQAHKERYEDHVKEAARRFISDFGPALHEISPHFSADPRPVGGSLFRIYRDVRFSRDKSPYKTHVGIQFRHKVGRDVHAPGFYLHLEPGRVMVAAGIWHPDRASLEKIREALLEQPDRWGQIRRRKAFAERFEMGGESLKRPPRGYDPDHPLIEDLRRKDFYGFTDLSEEAALSAGFLDEVAGSCRTAGPLVQFLCEAVGVAY